MAMFTFSKGKSKAKAAPRSTQSKPKARAKKVNSKEPAKKIVARERRLLAIKSMEAKAKQKKERRKKIAKAAISTAIFAFKTAKAIDKKATNGFSKNFKW